MTLAKIEKLFGRKVRKIVAILSRRKNENYFTYIFRVLKNKSATKIKIADIRDNLSDGFARHPIRYRVALWILETRFSFSF
jgi:hypothetical protein